MFPVLVQAEPESLNTFNVLCYHDVQYDPDEDPEPYTVSITEIVQQFAWLKQHGYHVINIDDLLAAQSGKRNLPNKAVMLTFDDGYRGFYSHVYPLLKAFNYPAVLALVGSWLQLKPGEKVPYDVHDYDRSSFLGEDEIREMSSSGLVEIASHSYGLHKGIVANPQGNLLPAAVARRYDPQNHSYENDAAYRSRIKSDLKRNSAYIRKITGKHPRVMVWPYGQYNESAIEIARNLGMPITFNLKDGVNAIQPSLSKVNRWLVDRNTSVSGLAEKLLVSPKSTPQRVMHVDLDYVYDPDPKLQEEYLGMLLDRVKAMNITTVYLQSFADPDGNGAADSMYFPNRHLPLRADLFSRVSWQLSTRAGVKVFAWMPLLAFDLPVGNELANHRVESDEDDISGESYSRLTPFDPKVRQLITEIYVDLAKSALFDGILFHDDATFGEFEDVSPWALEHYSRKWGFPKSISEIRRNPDVLKNWTRHKTRYLTEFSLELSETVRKFQPELKTARNIYAEVVLNPDSEMWFAQSLPDFIGNYDYTAIMAMPYMENVEEPMPWLKKLVYEVAKRPDSLNRSVFELQSVDWRTTKKVDNHELAKQMKLLQHERALNFGYYPDDFLNNSPSFDVIRPFFSLQTFPYSKN